MQCIALTSRENSELIRQNSKMELLGIVSDLMPQGSPNFVSVVNYPTIANLEQEHGKINIIKILYLLVVDFCNTMNVVRNMTDEQQIEAAHMLLDESGNFRLEDYVMMFTMAKRGQLGIKLIDRIDLPIITQLLDAYWSIRDNEGKNIQERTQKVLDNEINTIDATFATPIADFMKSWADKTEEEIKRDEEEKEIERKEKRKQDIQAFAKLHNIDLNKLNQND